MGVLVETISVQEACLQDVLAVFIISRAVRYRVHYESVAIVTRATPSPGPVHASWPPVGAAAVLARAVKDAAVIEDEMSPAVMIR